MNWNDFINPQQLLGQADPAQLLAAAARFPAGAAGLAFALFWAPAGLPIAYLFASLLPGVPAAILLAGIPAGVVLARVAGLNPLATFALYVLSDVLGALICHPLYGAARRLVRRVPILQGFARRMMKVAMFGTRVPRAEDIHSTGRVMPALFRIGTVGFGIDVYTAGMIVAGLPVPRLLGWASAIAGDLIWFAVLLGISIATAHVVDDYRIQIVVVLVATIVIPHLAKRVFPALRDDPQPRRAPATGNPAALPVGPAAFSAVVAANGAVSLTPAAAVSRNGAGSLAPSAVPVSPVPAMPVPTALASSPATVIEHGRLDPVGHTGEPSLSSSAATAVAQRLAVASHRAPSAGNGYAGQVSLPGRPSASRDRHRQAKKRR